MTILGWIGVSKSLGLCLQGTTRRMPACPRMRSPTRTSLRSLMNRRKPASRPCTSWLALARGKTMCHPLQSLAGTAKLATISSDCTRCLTTGMLCTSCLQIRMFVANNTTTSPTRREASWRTWSSYSQPRYVVSVFYLFTFAKHEFVLRDFATCRPARQSWRPRTH